MMHETLVLIQIGIDTHIFQHIKLEESLFIFFIFLSVSETPGQAGQI